MKKTFIALFAITMIGGTFASCKKDKKVDCTSAGKKVTDAGIAYSQSQTSANCKSYKAALQDYLNSDCFTGLSSEQKAAYQESLNALTCAE
ncbi:MAG: hypothetical protein QM768_08165 [Agriterribacter sp.]